MSSIRAALVLFLSTIVLVAGAPPIVAADAQQPPRDPVAQRAPAGDAMSIAELHRRAVALQDKATDTRLTSDERLKTILEALSYENQILGREPEFVGALVYKGLLLRMQARLTTDPAMRAELSRQADDVEKRAMAMQIGATQRPSSQHLTEFVPRNEPPPPPSAERSNTAFAQLLEQYQPVRIGGNLAPPTKIRDVKPVYPPVAQANKLQGVVIAEVLVGTDGRVVDANILRSIPVFDEAALGAIRQWAFRPTLLNGVPTPVLMTVTVNFTAQ